MNRYGSFASTSDGDNPPNNNEDEEGLLRRLASTADDIHEDQDVLSCAESESLLPQQQPKYLSSPFEDTEDPLRRATALRLTSFQRPHMRAFHGAHLLFCSSWIVWFSMAPLLPVLSDQLRLTKSQVWTSNVAALAGSVVLRLVLGPFCDQYGGRQILIGLLVVTALPCGIAGLLVHDYASLVAVRAWIGCVGATLVPVQVWLSSMFAPSCLGQVLGWATGWGAAGGGIAQVLMGSGVYPFCLYITNNDADLSWRLSLVFPSLLALALSYYFWHCSDDVPLGSIAQLKSTGRLVNRSAADSFRTGVVNVNAWILFCQFAACMGVELAMDSGLTLHLSTRFDLPTAQAAAYASIFGGTNLFARGLGGLASDRLHARFSLKGRLWFQFGLMFTEGLLIYCFIECQHLPSTIAALAVLAIVGQCCIVNSLGIVPYVDRRSTGTISGIAGAGGNLGGVILSSVFRHYTDAQAFVFMSLFCVCASALTPMIVVAGYEGMVWGEQRTARERSTVLTPR